MPADGVRPPQGTSRAAAQRLSVLREIPKLESTPVVLRLAADLVTDGAISREAGQDALHVAVAAVHGMHYGARMETIVTLKITLLRAKPPIWRRLEVPASNHLGDLHHTLNAAMGWLDSHLHTFDVDGLEYSISDDDIWIDADAPLPVDSVTLADLVRDGVKRFGYWYDFGDSWHHDVIIEKTGPAVEGVCYPRCVAGRRACPTEDCGGLWGFSELQEVMADPHHPEHDELEYWYGRDFDPKAFSAGEVSERMRKVVSGELPEEWDRPEPNPTRRPIAAPLPHARGGALRKRAGNGARGDAAGRAASRVHAPAGQVPCLHPRVHADSPGTASRSGHAAVLQGDGAVRASHGGHAGGTRLDRAHAG